MKRTHILILLVIVCSFYGVSYEELPPYRQLGSFSFKDPFFPDAGSAAIPGWEIKGSTVVMQDFVRLTSAENGRSGWITNRRPYFMESVNLTLAFHVHSSNKNGGDGIALWLSESPLKPGPVFAAAETWSGVAIIMDTWSNSGQDSTPQIALHYNDGKKTYSVSNDGAETFLKKCSANYRNSEISYLNVVIYDNLLSVSVAPYGEGSWTDCIQNFYIEMPNRYFFSISAMTGGLADNHDIKSFQVGTHDVVGDKKERIKRDNEPSNNNVDPTINNDNAKNSNKENNENKVKENNNAHDNSNNNQNTQNNQNKEVEANNANNEKNLNTDEVKEEEKIPLVLSPDYLEQQAKKKKEELMSHFPNQEFWDQVQDDDEDIMGKIRNMKEQFGHQLLQLQFSFRDQIQEIKGEIPTALSVYNNLKDDIVKIEETLAKSGTIVGMIHKEIASLSAEPEVSKEVENVMNIVGNRLKNLEGTLQKMNNLINKVQNEQRAQLDAEKAEKQRNEGGSIFPALIIIVIVLVVIGVIVKFFCLSSSKKIKKEGIL